MRKGVTPLIAAVLLIAITASLAFIIYSSGREFITGLSPPPNCESIAFEAGIYHAGEFYVFEVNNIGNGEINGFDLLISNPSLDERDVRTIDMNLVMGASDSQVIDITDDLSEKEIMLIPRAKNAEGVVSSCDAEYGQSIEVFV